MIVEIYFVFIKQNNLEKNQKQQKLKTEIFLLISTKFVKISFIIIDSIKY